jgi:hypothetical protein
VLPCRLSGCMAAVLEEQQLLVQMDLLRELLENGLLNSHDVVTLRDDLAAIIVSSQADNDRKAITSLEPVGKGCSEILI